MTFPPGDITLLDAFDRADGNVWDGAGATLWHTTDRQGNASHLRVVGGHLKVDAHGGGATTESVADFIRIFKVTAIGAGFGVTIGYRLTSLDGAGSGYLWSMFGGTWHLYRLDAGSATEVGNGAVAGGLSANTRVAVKAVGSTHEVYVGSLLAFPDTPVLSFTDGAHLGPGAISVDLDDTDWTLDDYSRADLTAASSPVTIYVDPDHAAASDSYSRGQASNPATPMVTVQAAGWLVRSTPDWADTIVVKVCTTADLGDLKDPHIQPALDFRSSDRSPTAPGWPAGMNAGNQPILLKGDVADDVNPRTDTLPKILAFNSRGLQNWIVQGIQLGYDVDSGNDHNTFSVVERVSDITWRRCRATGGLAWVRMWNDGFTVDDCYIRSPLPPVLTNVHDATGIKMDGSPADGSPTDYGIGQLLVQDSAFSFIRGDDAISVGGIEDRESPLWTDASIIVRRCIFDRVNGDAAYHDDSIQVVSCPRITVDRCIFVSCDTALIASDGRNGSITFTRNLTVGMDTPLQVQGTDEITIEHNTFNHADAAHKDASVLFLDRTPLPTRTVGTIRNNIIGGFYMPSVSIDSYFSAGTVISHNLWVTHPGLVTAWGTQLATIPELGHSSRLDAIPNQTAIPGQTPGTLGRNWELSNSPLVSPGIGDGLALGYDVDVLGRAYASPPDVGALQSDPAQPVTPVSRPPYVLSRVPGVNASGVSALTTVEVVLYPRPGQSIDPATIPGALSLKDPGNASVPGTLTFDTETGTARLSVTGRLYPYVVYTAVLDDRIADSEGSHIDGDVVWSFTVAGPSGPAVYVAGPVAGWTVGALS